MQHFERIRLWTRGIVVDLGYFSLWPEDALYTSFKGIFGFKCR